MKKIFRSIDDVLGSGIGAGLSPSPGLDRILKSTRLEDKLYSELREGDAEMDSVEAGCVAKLPAFPALARDIYQGFYSLNVRRNDESDLSDIAKRFNSHILDSIMTGEEYPTIKSVCEGRQLPAYDAAAEFVRSISSSLDELLKEAGGDKGAINTLEKLNQQGQDLFRKLSGLHQDRDQQGPSPELDRKITDTANKAAGKSQQVEAVGRQVSANLMKNKEAIGAIVAQAAQSAKYKAEETAQALAAWGTDDSGANPRQTKLNREVVERVRKSPVLTEVAKHLGRFREMMAKARKNGYAFGRGEKYALEFGNDLNRILTSEFSMLAVPSTIPVFLRKYQNKALQQYKRREPVFKGCGDIIMCLDESSSTVKDAPWGKAVALALLDVAMAGGRKFALIHFSGTGKYRTDVFLPGGYGTDDVFAAAEAFLGGGTDFVTPLNEAVLLINGGGFENADIIFVTDGICSLPETFLNTFKQDQSALKFKVTGVVMDVESSGMYFSLKPFCEHVYRTSELSRDSIAGSILSNRA